MALVIAAAIVSGSALARGARWQRTTWFETIGMTALGASAGLAALAGGAELRVAAALALVIGAHTGLAVPLVRSEVRPREREHARATARLALGALATVALVLALIGAGRLAIALLPRALHALSRSTASPSPWPPNVVGIRETAMLALVVILFVTVRQVTPAVAY
jgi:hypothetical protein